MVREPFELEIGLDELPASRPFVGVMVWVEHGRAIDRRGTPRPAPGFLEAIALCDEFDSSALVHGPVTVLEDAWL